MDGRRTMRSKNSGATSSPIGARAHAFSASDYDMLRAAKRLVDETADVFAAAESEVLVLVDATDLVGARLLRVHFQLQGMGATEAAVMVQTIALPVRERPAGQPPLVALWAPKRLILPLLVDLGFDVPSDWPRALAARAPVGHIFTLLKRDGRGLLFAVDYTHIDAKEGPAVNIGGEPERNIQ